MFVLVHFCSFFYHILNIYVHYSSLFQNNHKAVILNTGESIICIDSYLKMTEVIA